MMAISSSPKRKLLIAFDAFGTLFTPRQPIASQYAAVAKAHGLSGLNTNEVEARFKEAFKQESTRHPNYGKAAGLKADAWWANIITNTFTPLLKPGETLPSKLIPSLLDRFSSKEGYTTFADVLPFFEMLRRLRSKRREKTDRNNIWPWDNTIVGVITNSDDRVPHILNSLGLEVGFGRAGPPVQGRSRRSRADDIDFVVLSYDVGHEKPSKMIFEAAEAALTLTLMQGHGDSGGSSDGCDFLYVGNEYDLLYVGDNVEKDVLGAINAGWDALLVDRSSHSEVDSTRIERFSLHDKGIRDGKYPNVNGINVISSLSALQHWRPDSWNAQ